MAKSPKSDSSAKPVSHEQTLVALAFGQRGEFLAQGKLSSEYVKFPLKENELRQARIFILPTPEGKSFPRTPSLEEIENRITYEPVVRVTKGNLVVFEQIPDFVYERWWWKRCCVRGRVTNRTQVDGQLTTYPVCNAIVHICEVDRIWRRIELIPVDVLERLRRDLIEEPIPRPWPPIERATLPDPPQPLPSPRATGMSNISQLNTVSLPTTTQLSSLQVELPTASLARFRELLQVNFEYLLPRLCLYPYLRPYFLRCQKVGKTVTDANGRYEHCFYHQEKAPDVYIWIEYPFDTGTETVYRPWMHCATRWNYDCGSDIDVQLSNSRIPPSCGDTLPGNIVAIRGINQATPLAVAQDLVADISLPGTANFRTVGLTNFRTSFGASLNFLRHQHVRPFYGNIPLYLQFGAGLIGQNIHYFRWEIRRTHNAALVQEINPSLPDTGWEPLYESPISRRYVIQTATDFQYRYYPMGPEDLSGELMYRIPAMDPQTPGIDGQPASTDPTARWTNYARVFSGYLNTHELENGLHQLRLRLYDQNGQPATVGPETFRVPGPSDSTQAAPNSHLSTANGGSVFQMFIRVDNEAPTATVAQPQFLQSTGVVDDSRPATPCGFLEYDPTKAGGDQLRISFQALHPQNFATYIFDLERGRPVSSGSAFTTGDSISSVSGTQAPDDYKLNGDTFQKDFPVATLLSGCASGKAAFSEVLRVYGLHTNGDNAGNLLTARATNAFALAPVE